MSFILRYASILIVIGAFFDQVPDFKNCIRGPESSGGG